MSEEDTFEDEVSRDEVAFEPSDAADPREIVEQMIPSDLLAKYEVHSYRSAATILALSHRELFDEICEALRQFTITETMIRTAGGNESEIPKLFSASLHPKEWRETLIRGDLKVEKIAKRYVTTTKTGKPLKKPKFEKMAPEPITRKKYLDGHKVDYVKGKVAFDLEWNSKDQTFDRDLYAFSAFAQTGVVDVGVLVTRGVEMTDFIKGLGPALTKSGKVEMKDGKPRTTAAKYGASTTWMGKLLYRLNAGRNGACPVLVFGITPRCVIEG
jgi:hypothetical protein